MTSSLVGSEMCIRDSTRKHAREHPHEEMQPPAWRPQWTKKSERPKATVSYTHLTLPTICSV
eukprot:2526270-Prorocentrum_lima.AAC.1